MEDLKIGDLLMAKDKSGTLEIMKFSRVGLDGIIKETGKMGSITHDQLKDWELINNQN